MKEITNIKIGSVYSRLKILEIIGRNKRSEVIVLCECECGNKKEIIFQSLINGNTTSCGCYNKEITAQRNRDNATHNSSKDGKLFWAWNHMIQRCEKDYKENKKYYKDRGITVCEEWHDYLIFKEWALNNGFKNDLSLDRKNVNGNYEPNNCRWATWKEQMNNTTINRAVTIDGVTKNLNEWAEISGIKRETLAYRLNSNWPTEFLFEKPTLSKTNRGRQ